MGLRGRYTSADPAALREYLKDYVKASCGSEALGQATFTDPLT